MLDSTSLTSPQLLSNIKETIKEFPTYMKQRNALKKIVEFKNQWRSDWTILHYCADRGYVSTFQHLAEYL
jgi:hypothetical protein